MQSNKLYINISLLFLLNNHWLSHIHNYFLPKIWNIRNKNFKYIIPHYLLLCVEMQLTKENTVHSILWIENKDER